MEFQAVDTESLMFRTYCIVRGLAKRGEVANTGKGGRGEEEGLGGRRRVEWRGGREEGCALAGFAVYYGMLQEREGEEIEEEVEAGEGFRDV